MEKVKSRKHPVDEGKQKRLAKGCTTLMYACQQGNTNDIVTEIRIKPKSIHRRDQTNKSALHYCCGQLDLVAAASVTVAAPELLESADEDGFTPLHLAVIQGNMPLVNLLLANKANVDALDNEGHSVIHWATVCVEVEALRALLAAGADISNTDINGGSPLHYAAQMSSGSAFRSQTPILALEILDILLQQPNIQVDVCDKDGRQPLLWAASAGAVKAILMLIKAGARVESSDKDGLTALHCAASRGHTECIDILITLCGAPTDLIDSNGCTALHYAVTLGHADATHLLLDLGADPNRQDRKGRTPAHCGCAKGQFETVKMLRDRRANMWLRNAKGDLPLHEAASSGRRELVQWLLDQRPKQVNTPSNDGRTILHIAAGNDYTDMCKMLIDFGADVNSIYRGVGNVVQTPLDCALQKGYRSTAKFLQLHGGLPSSKLHLSGRKPTALNDQELVKPLLYDKSPDENVKKTGSVLLLMNRSDSESNATGTGSDDKESAHHRKGRRSRKVCDCRDRCHHYYRRHRCRRRTSSCELIEYHHKKNVDDDDSPAPMCRSKSNVEICRYRRKRSKNRKDASPSSGSDEDSSSESYCGHGKHSRKRCQRHRRSASKNDSKNGKSIDAASASKTKKNDAPTKGKSSRAVKITNETAKKSSAEKKVQRTPPSKNDTKNDKKGPPSTGASKGLPEDNEQEKLSSVTKDVNETHKSSDVLPSSNDVEIAGKQHTSAAAAAAAATPATPANTKAEADKSTEQLTSEKTFVTKADVHTPQQTAEQQENSMAVAPIETPRIDIGIDDKQKDDAALKVGPAETTNDVPEINIISGTPEPSVKSADSQEKKSVDDPSTDTNKEANKEKGKEATSAAEVAAQKGESESQKSVEAQPATTQPTNDTANASKDLNAAKVQTSAETLPSSSKEEPPQAAAPPVTATPAATAPVTTQQNVAAPAVSFQVVPESTDSNATAQNLDVKGTSSATPTDTPARKTSFTVLKSDESIEEVMGQDGKSRIVKVVTEKNAARPKSFKILRSFETADDDDAVLDPENDDDDDDVNVGGGEYSDSELIKTGGIAIKRRKRLKKRAKSSIKQIFASDAGPGSLHRQHSKDHDSGFEPSPRAMRSTKTSRAAYTALPERSRPDIPDGRTCSSRLEQRKPGDKKSVNMTTVSQSIQRNIRRYYMEHKIFQHLLELKSLQIRSNKVNEAVLVKRAVDDYHKSTMLIGAETGGFMRRYPYKEYTFKNFEIFLYEVLKSLQKAGTNNFQNISDVYLEAERRLSPNYSRCKNALYCTTKTHRCLHAAHAYTGIPCAAYIPMMNHHTIPKYGFGKTGTGSFFLPKIPNKGGKIGQDDGTTAGNTVSLELCHGNNKQLITLPAEKLDNNKRYYVTFTLKDDEINTKKDITSLPPAITLKGQK